MHRPDCCSMCRYLAELYVGNQLVMEKLSMYGRDNRIERKIYKPMLEEKVDRLEAEYK